ncbi:universal stress protein [Natronobeatus ordinarius]|uniref:universal stress protein n=1 Tax=Natronobeatus ordinarius TaxID=2963433 RepID=UPI0020CCE69C|nr:universal stress protein [Natronobeatus ordinarius]
MDLIVVAMDDSPHARKALEYALERFPDRTIRAVHVPEVSEFPTGTETTDEIVTERVAEILEEAEAIAAEHGREIETETTYGHAAKALVSYANDHDADHIVVGSRGRSGAKRLLLGSVAETIVRRADCPVVVVR